MLLGVVGVVAVQCVADDRDSHREELGREGPLDRELGAIAGMADAGLVLGFFEAHLDGPAIAVTLDDLCGGGVQVGGDQRELIEPAGFARSAIMIIRTGV